MRNVVVYDKHTNREVAEFEFLPDTESEIKPILVDRVGYGSYRLRWKDRKRKDGKYVEFPRQMLVLVLAPLEGGKQPRTPERAGLGAISQAVEGLPGSDSLVVKLILERMDQHYQELGKRIDTVMDFLQEEEEYDEPGAQGGLPTAADQQPGDTMGVLQSLLKDPAYAGLIGGVMANAANPEGLNAAIKTEIDKNPALLSGIFAKFLPLMLDGAV